jgi:hypothetical protein
MGVEVVVIEVVGAMERKEGGLYTSTLPVHYSSIGTTSFDHRRTQ